MTAPFTHDPAATAAFARLFSKMEVEPQLFEVPFGQLKAVVIGGGTGAPVSIRTLLSLGVKTSAVVAMADDGGSTGILREEAGVLPPGDIRKCLAAMAADPEDPLTKAFKYRFAFARNHTLGNLMLSALEDATGSFPEAIAICGKLLNARGEVFPSTLEKVRLSGRTCDGALLEGQATVCKSKTALSRVWLESDAPITAYEPAVEAIRDADLIVLGPGSLFTSIIPNLLVPGIIDAIRSSRGVTVFVCSLADMQGETWGLSAREHYDALASHGMEGSIDYMLIHSPDALIPESRMDRMVSAVHAHMAAATDASSSQALWDDSGVRRVYVDYKDVEAIHSRGTTVLVRDLEDPVQPTWHDPEALRAAFGTVIKLSRARIGRLDRRTPLR